MEFRKDIRLKIELSNDKSEILELFYLILDIDIAARWVNLIKKNIDLGNTLRYNYRRILNKSNLKKSFKEFRNNVIYINKNYDKKLTDIESFDFLQQNQHILNDLHEEYEIYGDRLQQLIDEKYFSNPKVSEKYHPIWPGESHNKILHEAFLRLNEQIHNFEAIFRSIANPKKMLCTCLVDFMPAGIHENLKPEDFILFDPNHEWGWMYLGYNTLGKHWSSACNDNDIDVVKRKTIRPQQRFAAEFYMSFNIKKDLYQTRIKLYDWWIKNNFSSIIDPELKLRDLALGFIPVARFYGYAKNGNFIKITDQTNRQNFNQRVWSKYNRVKNVTIELT